MAKPNRRQDASLQIGDVANEAGVNTQTLRYYERRGIVRPIRRSQSGYRLYSSETTRIVRFIKRAQELGFTLDEIEELLALSGNEDRTCNEVRKVAEAKLDNIEGKIAALQAMKKPLAKLIQGCASRRGTAPDCPILDALDDKGGAA